MSSFSFIPDIPKGQGLEAWKTYAWFLRYAFFATKRQTAIIVASLIFGPLSAAGMLWLTRQFIDSLTAGNIDQAKNAFIFLIAVTVIGIIAERGREYVRETARLSLDFRLRQDMILHLRALDPAVIEHPRFQALYHAYETQRGYLLSVAQEGYWLLFTLFVAFGYASVLFLLPWWTLIAMTLPFAVLIRSMRHEKTWSWGVLNYESRQGKRGWYFSSILLDTAWLQHRWTLGLHQRFYAAWKGIFEKGLQLKLREGALRVGSNLLADMVLIIGMFGGAMVLFRDAIETGVVGALVVFFPAFRSFSERVTSALSGFGWLQKQLMIPQLLHQVLSLPARVEGKKLLPKQPLQIEFDHVSFAYPDTTQEILHDLCLSVREGEYTALVGLNGAGKSTFLKLLAGIYRPTSGRILVNGIPLESIRSDAWVQALGYMNQDVPKFEDTVQNIIRYGNPTAPWGKRAKEVLRVSGFDEMIASFPRKDQTYIGRTHNMPEDEPIDLSGGQRQLLMIAQTLFRPARVLIFDEPTSAVDAEKEDAFFSKLPEAVEGRLCMVVSHRFSVLRRAERILVMDSGKIIEDGSHDELLAKQGRYAELFALQAKMYN